MLVNKLERNFFLLKYLDSAVEVKVKSRLFSYQKLVFTSKLKYIQIKLRALLRISPI